MSYAIEGLDMSRVAVAPIFGMPAYSWRGVCRIGDCRSPATDPHHVIPRGRIGGPARYVLIDGVPWPNVAGTCRLHHDRITRGESVLFWQDESGWWYRSPRREARLRPLGHAEAMVQRGGRCCAMCGQTLPRPQPFELRRRERQPFTISAPVDQGEDGPAMLASLCEQVAEKIGMANPAGSSAQYHAVTTALTAVLLHDDSLQGLRHHFNGEDR